MGCFNSKVSADKASGGKLAGSSSGANLSAKSVDSAQSGGSHKNSLKLDTSDANVSIKTLTFRHVMHDPVGREYFMKFLKKEHAEENLTFFEVSFIIVDAVMSVIHCSHHTHLFLLYFCISLFSF